MLTIRPILLAAVAVLTLSSATPLLANPGGGGGGGNGGSSEEAYSGPSLKQAQADLDAKNWKAAINKLKTYVASNTGSADAYNMLGYAYRNMGDYKRAAQFYARALRLNPRHLGALEYQGEMFVILGQIEDAKANLAKIKTIAGTDNENYEDLAEAING